MARDAARLFLFFLCLSHTTSGYGADRHDRELRIGLALEGGGALGFAHLGVLKVLEQERVPVHAIAGTSMGAIVGAAYASGRTIAEMENVLATTDWDALFDETAPRRMIQYRRKGGRDMELFGEGKLGLRDGQIITPTALIEGQYVEFLCQKLFGKSVFSGSFDELPIPFRAVAADIETGEEVVLASGSLARAARASMSVPGVFSPVEIDGRLLVDGGVTNNFPVDIARAMGVDVVIGVQFKTPLRSREELTGPIPMLAQVLDILLAHTSERGLARIGKGDVLIQPDISAFTSTDFDDAPAIMLTGEVAARHLAHELRRFSLSPAAYRAYHQTRTEGTEVLPVVDIVRVEGVQTHRAERIQRAFRKYLHRTLDRNALEESIREEFQTGEYLRIGYEIEERDGANELVIHAREKDWLKHFIRFGFSIEDDFEGSSFYALAADLRFNDLNSWGGYADVQTEIGRTPRLFGELYQPLASSLVFVAPEFSLARRQLVVRDDGDEVARYFRSTALLALKTGLSLGRFGEVALGVLRGPGELQRDLGDPALPEFDYEVGEGFARMVLDQLNNPDFPTNGYRIALRTALSRDRLGASSPYEQSRLLGGLPLTADRWTLLLNGEAGLSSDDLPPEQSFSLGGMFDISGYEQASLTADNYWIGRSRLFYRFFERDLPLLHLGGYVGTTLEFASLRSRIEQIGDRPNIVAGSVFVGLDTPLFPLYFSFGLSDEGERAIGLTMGRLSASRR